VRLSSKYAELENRGSEIFIGNLREERDIQKACRRVKYIISAHGSGGDAQELDYRANVDLIDQAKTAGVEHFVFISVLGADRGYEDATVFKAKREVEKYLQASGLNYTILRPSGLASSLLPLAERFKQTGIYLLSGDSKNRSSIVSTDDLAKIAVESTLNIGARNRIFPVGGPDILKREDIPRIFGRLFNREPIIINPPLMVLDGIRGSIGLFNPTLYRGLGTLRVLVANEFYCTANETDTLETVYNLKLESLETFLRRYLVT
jgi:uncharacterized protein YbjT (DUF2867 family)